MRNFTRPGMRAAERGVLAAATTVLGIGLIGAPAALGAAGHFTEAPGSPFGVGEFPRNLVSGDFDGDGLADLAVANSGERSVSILLGTGDGDFDPAATSPEEISEPAWGIDAGDFDDDGNLDLAIASWGAGPSNISILLGDGTGDFSLAGSPIDTGASATPDIKAADFDGDGELDLAVVDQSNDDIAILLGDGDGAFTEAQGSPIAVGGSPAALAVGNLNGDGDLDLAVPNRNDGTVTVLAGDGDGGFSEAQGSPLDVEDYPRAIAVDQLDGEPGDDIAVASGIDRTVGVLLNDGSGGFSAAPGSPLTASGASYVEPADLDGDGSLDLAIAGGGSEVFTFRNDGNAGFTRFSDQGESVGNSPLGIVAGDFDGAGLPDLAVANYNDDDVTVLLNDSGPSVAMHGRPFNGRASNDPSPVYELSSDDPEATFVCRLDDGPWEACDSSVELGPLADGEHRLRGRAVDANGNVSRGYGHRRFVIDTELLDPEASIDRRPRVRGARITIHGAATAGESGVGALRARIRTGGRTYVFDPARVELEPGSRERLQATLAGAGARRVKSALAEGRRPHVRAWLKVRDQAGNSIRIKRRLRLRD